MYGHLRVNKYSESPCKSVKQIAGIYKSSKLVKKELVTKNSREYYILILKRYKDNSLKQITSKG